MRQYFTTPAKAITVIALAIALVFTGSFFPGSDASAAAKPAKTAKTAKKVGLKTFKSYKSLKKYVKKVKAREKKKQKEFLKRLEKARKAAIARGEIKVPTGVAFEDAMIKIAPSPAASGKGGSEGSKDHSSTYVQTQGVDEADIIRTDGDYIYCVDEYDGVVKIYSAHKGNTKLVSSVKLATSKRDYSYIYDIFVKGNKLIITSDVDTWSGYDDLDTRRFDKSITRVGVYDITNRKKPKLLGKYDQSGYMVSSRMIGDYVYLVTDDYYPYDTLKYQIPYATRGKKLKKVKANDICAFPGSKSTNYAVVGSIDISSSGKGALKTNTKAVLGASDDIYCSLKNLYLAASPRGYYFDEYYDSPDDLDDWESDMSVGYSGKTQIIKMSLNKGEIRFEAKGQVPGLINNQFSMDEDDGYLRVATTGRTKDRKDINCLTVLNSKMKKVGRTKGFAKGEHIEAVRFVGKKGYVITYEETDPLFVIDLKDPKNPKITGSVEITGFSTLLHPVGTKKLLGIGHATSDGGDIGMEIQDGLKLVLFNIADPNDPKVADSKSYNGYDSSVQYDHRGLVVNKKKKYYAIPYGVDYGNNGGVLIFSVKGNKIDIKKQWKAGRDIHRCIYIGNYVYAMDYYGRIKSFKY